MTMHGGRAPYDEAGALTGPARVLVAPTSVTAPTSLWDVIPAKANGSGEYPAKTGWRDIGLATDAPTYTHGGDQSGLTYQQPTGELFQVVSAVNRAFECSIADYREENMALIENQDEANIGDVAAVSGTSTAGRVIPIGLYKDLRVVRVCMVSYRPSGADAGVLETAGTDPRPTAVALIIPRCQVSTGDRTVSPAKGDPAGTSMGFTAVSEPTADAGAEHGFWFLETPKVTAI